LSGLIVTSCCMVYCCDFPRTAIDAYKRQENQDMLAAA